MTIKEATRLVIEELEGRNVYIGEWGEEVVKAGMLLLLNNLLLTMSNHHEKHNHPECSCELALDEIEMAIDNTTSSESLGMPRNYL